MAGQKLAYLAEGRLFFRENGSSRLIESPFGQDVINRALQRAQKNEWKTGGADRSGMYNRQTLWGTSGESPAASNVRITAVTAGQTAAELLYVVSTESVGGVFTYNLDTGKETRHFHKEALYLTDFAKQPDGELIACSRRIANGTACIAVINGQDVSEITEGDSIDECPSWIPGLTKKLLYQCSGVARNSEGYRVGTGHSYIQKLDLQNGELTTVLEDEHHDFLCPKMNRNHDLYYIKRPYDTLHKPVAPGKLIKDVFLFPFRLARAFFDFLNVFSMVFSKKPLTTASGPKTDGPDEKTLFLRGRTIDAQKALQENVQEDEAPALVPQTWQLICRKSDGSENVLARCVVSYDLADDGTIYYSNGVAVYRLVAGSKPEMLFKDKLIDTVVLIPETIASE